jgi:phosphatidylserine decarboxylase
VRIPIVREGLPFFLPPLLLAAVLAGFGLWPWATAAGALGVFLLCFFRDPERHPGGGPGAVLAPADGRVVRVRSRDDGATEVSIFLSPLDVHVNRAPVSGTLTRVDYHPGRFRPAYDPAAASDNERLRLRIDGHPVALDFQLVTGVLVRRIALWKRQGDDVTRGERLAIMKFGSRVDLWLPAGVAPRVGEGARVRAGETVIAEAGAR